jgi:hypothetical protein
MTESAAPEADGTPGVLQTAGAVQVMPATLETMDAQIAADIPTSWAAAWRLARRISYTPFVPKALQGDPNSVLACILTGEELGLGPMQSLRMVHVIEGRPAASAELMRALVNRAGHRVDVVEARQDRVTLSGVRRDTQARATVMWTIKDAERAGLVKNPAWSKYPRSMLLARATSELCRMLFADVIGGLYTPEETAAIEGRAWEPADPAELVDPVSMTHFDNDDETDVDDLAAGEQLELTREPIEEGP